MFHSQTVEALLMNSPLLASIMEISLSQRDDDEMESVMIEFEKVYTFPEFPVVEAAISADQSSTQGNLPDAELAATQAKASEPGVRANLGRSYWFVIH